MAPWVPASGAVKRAVPDYGGIFNFSNDVRTFRSGNHIKLTVWLRVVHIAVEPFSWEMCKTMLETAPASTQDCVQDGGPTDFVCSVCCFLSEIPELLEKSKV